MIQLLARKSAVIIDVEYAVLVAWRRPSAVAS
jgi:hypothetical protein